MATTGLKLLAASLALAALSTGCAIHSQAPVREIAYDFSDADFYDRAYAASPQDVTNHSEYQVVSSAEPVAAEATAADVETIDVLDHTVVDPAAE